MPLKIEIDLTPEELMAFGYCTMVGYMMAKDRDRDEWLCKVIGSLTTKVYTADKHYVDVEKTDGTETKEGGSQA